MPPPRSHFNRYGLLTAISLLTCRLIMWLLIMSLGTSTLAGGGGVVINEDACIIPIDFYTAHLTAYQPDSNDNEEFCQDIPGIGDTIFVFNYLHSSLNQVPVGFRIIKDVTGLGRFVRWEDLQRLDAIKSDTVFYQPPSIEADGSYQVRYNFAATGNYIGIVTAGHPSNGNTYRGVFPFSVGASNYPLWLLYVVLAGLALSLARYVVVTRQKRASKTL